MKSTIPASRQQPVFFLIAGKPIPNPIKNIRIVTSSFKCLLIISPAEGKLYPQKQQTATPTRNHCFFIQDTFSSLYLSRRFPALESSV